MNYLTTATEKVQNEVINISNGYQKRSFKYDLLDNQENFKKTLTNVELKGNSISFDNFSNCKRYGNIKLLGNDPDIDFINDRIKIYITLDNGVTELTYPLGVYLLSSPIKKMVTKTIYSYSVDVYSKLQILIEDKVIERYVLKKDTTYTTTIKSLLSSAGLDISKVENSDETASRDIVFNAGTSKLDIINNLLEQINFYPVYTDFEGVPVCKPSTLDKNRTADYFYRINQDSIVDFGLTQDLDLFNVPNVITRVVTNAETETLISTYKNYDESDPTSIPSRGREIDDYKEISDIPSQLSLDNFVQLEAERLREVYGEVSFSTSLNPLHEFKECIEVNGEVYIESSWTMSLDVTGKMSHEARRVVYV